MSERVCSARRVAVICVLLLVAYRPSLALTGVRRLPGLLGARRCPAPAAAGPLLRVALRGGAQDTGDEEPTWDNADPAERGDEAGAKPLAVKSSPSCGVEPDSRPLHSQASKPGGGEESGDANTPDPGARRLHARACSSCALRTTPRAGWFLARAPHTEPPPL